MKMEFSRRGLKYTNVLKYIQLQTKNKIIYFNFFSSAIV